MSVSDEDGMMGLVDWRFFLSWSKCPFSVAMVVLNDVLRFSSSIPGHVMKLSLLMDFMKVEITGENAQPCKYLERSDLD